MEAFLPLLLRIAFLAVLVIVVLMILGGMFFTVTQQTNAVVERFSKYARTARPGLNVKIPLIEQVVGRVSLKVQQLIVEVDTKTLDDVFVKVFVAVQYRVIEGKVFDAYYKLQDHNAQIKSYVLDVVRAQVPAMKLDDVFAKKNEVGEAIKKELAEAMQGYGFEIPSALVTDIDPAANVKAAMNEIQTQTRLQVAAQAKGEAQKILVVKAAEAEAESKKLQGQGIANQRRAIVDGLRESVDAFKGQIDGMSAKDVLNLVLITQYFDMMKAIGESAGSKVILTPHSPSAFQDVVAQIRNAIITGEEAAGGKDPAATGAPSAAAKVEPRQEAKKTA